MEAVEERPDLIGMRDADVFAAAQLEGRVIVTENVADYLPLARWYLHRGSHCGLILTVSHHFPRHEPRTLGRIVASLDALLSDPAMPPLTDAEHWPA